MATPASIAALISTKVLANTTASAATASPISKTEAIASGVTKAQILTVVAGRDASSDANIARLVASYDVTIVHMLSDATDDATYINGAALTDQAVLMVPSFFRDIAGVKEIVDGPELAKPERERPGNVVEYTVTVQLSIVP